MNHIGTQTITTGRLILRRFTMDDAATMFSNWANDPEITAYLSWPTHLDVETSKKVLESWVKDYEKENFYLWAIVPKEFSEPIGSISIVQQREDIAMVQVGYCIGKNWWHRGFTSEALAALIDIFFDQVGVSRIEARHDPNNPNSGKVMQKCGMKYEGTLRRADKNNQGICDASYYAILREEWKNDAV
jgi:[ribosomal protein S5]-alanine N-acetyltransferase